MKLVFTNICYLVLFVIYNYLCLAQDESDKSFGIGSFFEEEDQSKIAFDSQLEKAGIFNENHHISDKDSFKAQKLMCKIASEKDGLAAVFGPNTVTTAPIVESICINTGLPNIQFSWHPSTTITSETDTVINFFPKLSSLSHGIATLVKNLQWRSFVFLYENDDGLIQLQDILKLQTIDNSVNIIMKHLGSGPDYRPLLKEIRSSSENKIILDCHTDNILPILSQAKSVNLTQTLYSFFLSSLDAHTVNLDFLNITANITTIRIINPSSSNFLDAFYSWKYYADMNKIPFLDDPYSIKTETALVHDAIKSFTESLDEISREQLIETQPINCHDFDVNLAKWSSGLDITNSMKQKKQDGISGIISFDQFGQRDNFTIYLIEKNRDVLLAKWHPDPKRWDEIEFIRSESDRFQAQLERMRTGTIIVASRLFAPYLMEKPPPESGERLDGNNRYEGFAMDLMSEIAHILKFNKFEFRVNPEGNGKYDPVTKTWDGLINDILEHKADLAICDLTITHERREFVDFSMPFMRLGISILFKKSEEEPVNMFAFLDPFSMEVWIYTATVYLAVSVILYFVARMAPGDWENPHLCDQNPTELENIWDIKNCLWLTLGSIMTQGCDILPKGISSRLATSMWWFFSLIMTSSYTANLAAFLTMERMEPTIDSAEALSQQTKIKYGTLDRGSTQSFFRDSNYTPYARMWTNMIQDKQSFAKTNDDGVNRVLSSTKQRKYAFIMESSAIEYELATKCELKQVGKWLDSKGYGIAMPIDYPFRSNINAAILKLQEDGKLNELKIQWWQKNRKEKLCEKPKTEDGSSELSMENVGGVFLVLGIGVGVAFFIAIMEFLWNVRNVSVEQHITFLTALKLELIFAMNVWVTKKRTKPQISESSSTSSHDSRSIAPAILHGGSIGFNLHLINRAQSHESNNK